MDLRLFESNSAGLPAVYNQAIEEARGQNVILIFCHDDVHICDFFWPNQLSAAFRFFDVVGIAGNRRRVANQPSWAFLDSKWVGDIENISGVMAHGSGFPGARLSTYGPSGEEVKLLDGVWIACQNETLQKHNLRFDERFKFHFYDMDFCRQAELSGLKMGTWPISIIHESSGNVGGDRWDAEFAKYLDKWKS